MKIDAHQHFWALERGDYGWLSPELAVLYRDFGPTDLAGTLKKHNIDGTVLVQAAPTIAETHYMLSLAEQNSFIKGVVGWTDFESDTAAESIEQLAQNRKLVGLRPMIQDIENVDWMLDEKLTNSFLALIKHNLVFDALTLPVHLPNLQKLISRHPQMNVVIDHGSKPAIASNSFEPWAAQMALLAAESEACVKLSGLVTEADQDWTTETLKPYADHLLTQFGPERIIWGSDWPVCTLAATYSAWCEATESLLAGLSPTEQEAILGGNAARVYALT